MNYFDPYDRSGWAAPRAAWEAPWTKAERKFDEFGRALGERADRAEKDFYGTIKLVAIIGILVGGGLIAFNMIQKQS